MPHYNFHTEKELLNRVAAGDEKAFRDLFGRYYGQLYQYIFALIKSKQVSEELVMDVFLKIWLGRDLITQIEKFDAFLLYYKENHLSYAACKISF